MTEYSPIRTIDQSEFDKKWAARFRKIEAVTHTDGLQTPQEILNDYITNRGNPLLESGLHPHAGLVHTFDDWQASLVFAIPALDSWIGENNEKVDFEERARVLFDLFCVELKRRGVSFEKSEKDDIFQEYLKD